MIFDYSTLLSAEDSATPFLRDPVKSNEGSVNFSPPGSFDKVSRFRIYGKFKPFDTSEKLRVVQGVLSRVQLFNITEKNVC